MRVKIVIYCKNCGEKFILRGKRVKGWTETGFKQCLCENKTDFHIKEKLI